MGEKSVGLRYIDTTLRLIGPSFSVSAQTFAF
jgi:hypothetical protein